MKLLKLLPLAILALLMTSCETDPLDPGTGGGTGGSGTGGNMDPQVTVSLEEGADVLSSDAMIAPEMIFSVQLAATTNGADLNSIEIQENGARIEDFANRITIEGQPAPASAVLVPEQWKQGFSIKIDIKAQADRSKSLYTFIVTDTDMNSAFTDIEIDTEVTGSGTLEPSLTLLRNSSIILDPGSLFGFDVEALAGENPITSVGVFDTTGVQIEAGRCYYGDISADTRFDNNPYLIPMEDQMGFSKKIYIKAPETQTEETYLIVISDNADEPNIGFVTITMNTYPDGISGNPVTTKRGVLFNRAGPVGRGGLDLDGGLGTGSSSLLAEIKDNGIDTDLDIEANWLQTISPVNGSTIKRLIPGAGGLLESFSFDALETDAQVRDIWGNGVELTETNAVGEPSTGRVAVEDIFVAFRDGIYYAFQVTEIAIDPIGNEDSYTMDIKY